MSVYDKFKESFSIRTFLNRRFAIKRGLTSLSDSDSVVSLRHKTMTGELSFKIKPAGERNTTALVT